MKLYILILCISFSQFSYSRGFFLEPTLNYVTTAQEQEFNITSPSSGEALYEGEGSANQYGLRLGYQSEKVYMGLQYSKSSGKHTDQYTKLEYGTTTTLISYVDFDTQKEDFGFFIGWKFGDLFRMWATFLSSELETTAGDGSQTNYEGASFLLGFGWRIYQYLSLNIELGATSYSIENGREYPFSTYYFDYGVTLKSQEFSEGLFLLGVSFPLGL